MTIVKRKQYPPRYNYICYKNLKIYSRKGLFKDIIPVNNNKIKDIWYY